MKIIKIINKMFLSHFENRKLKQLKSETLKYFKASKEIMASITKELIYYNIDFTFNNSSLKLRLSYDNDQSHLDLLIFPHEIRIVLGEQVIATYRHLKWYQYLPFFGKIGTRKKFYYIDDVVRALNTMIITGVKI